MALVWSAPVQALDWRFEPALDASATYTDNAGNTSGNKDEAMILRVAPGFTLRSEQSRRVEAGMRYGLSGVKRFGDERSDDLLHTLNASGKAELVDDFLFVEGDARVSQELIDLLGSQADATTSSGNRATVGTYSLSPHVKKRLGTFANASARYTASGAIFEDEVASTQRVNAFAAGLASGTRFGDFTWALDYSIRDAHNRNDVDTRFERAGLTLGHALTRKFRVFGTVGEEWNDYPAPPGTDIDGSFYSVGVGWAPSRRTSIEASTGERSYGRSYGLTAQHRTRTTNWTLGYADDVSDMAQFLQASGTVYNYLCVGADGSPSLIENWPYPFPPASGCVPSGGTPGLLFDLRGGVFIARTLRGSVGWTQRKLTHTLSYSDSRREYIASGIEDRTRVLGLATTYRMSRQTTADAGLALTRTQMSSTPLFPVARDDDLFSLSVGMTHQFAKDLSGALIFRHTQRDSNVATADYDENSLTASVSLRF
jgi:uncharacterized protein (PEP-CTERM system associated)